VGDPARIATRHDGCGAAIRVVPVGIVCRPARFDDLVKGAREASIPTHGGSWVAPDKLRFPDHPMTIVPLALCLATLMGSAEEAILMAVNVGGDSDSVASIAGAVLGSRYPDTVNEAWYDIVETVNRHELRTVVGELVNLRQ